MSPPGHCPAAAGVAPTMEMLHMWTQIVGAVAVGAASVVVAGDSTSIAAMSTWAKKPSSSLSALVRSW
jgi:hypothetical protein